MSSSEPFHAAILAFSARSYGADAHFQDLIPALGRYKSGVRFTILDSTDRFKQLCEVNGIGFLKLSFLGISNKFVRALWEQTILPFVLKRKSYDVVYTGIHSGFLLSSIPHVTAVCNMENITPPTSGSSLRHRIRLRFLRWFTMASARKAARVVAVSNFVQKSLIARGIPIEKIDVIYYGADGRSSDRSVDQPEGEPFILSAGKFIRYMNLETLFRAFAKMKELGYRGELRFAGGGQDPAYEKQMRELVKDLGIDESTRFLGYVPRKTLRSLMRMCEVFLFPSTLEACPFTLLEAMSEGAPVVTTRCPPMPEHCGEAALYVDPKDHADFGISAYRVTQEPQLRKSLQSKALTQAKKFSWEKNIRLLSRTLAAAGGIST